MSTSEMNTEVRAELAELKALVRQQQSRIDQLEAADVDPPAPSAMSRRAVFGLAAAGVATAATVVTASPAAAAPTNVQTEVDNPAIAETSISNSATDSSAAFQGTTTNAASTGTGVVGSTSGTGYALEGVHFNATSTQPSVHGFHFGLGSGVYANTSNTANAEPMVHGQHSGLGDGVLGEVTNASSAAAGVAGTTAGTGMGVHGSGPTGVQGEGTTDGIGVRGVGIGPDGIGVEGTGPTGVFGFTAAGDAIFGQVDSGRAVVANATGDGLALSSASVNGIGARISSENSTGAILSSDNGIPLQIQPAAAAAAAHAAGAPEAGDHLPGMFYVDSDGDLFYCIASGSPGTWVQLNGQADGIVGGPTFLPTAQRAFDSRPGRLGSGAAKGTFAGGENRPVDLTVDTDLPAGATAAIVNLTVVNTGSDSGFASIYSGAVADLTPPTFSNINWFGVGQILANTTTTAVGSGTVKVYASSATDVIVDVIGYYM